MSVLNMEALSKSLQPYKDLVSSLASIFTIGQFFSGVFVCRDISRRGHTRGIPPTPFIGGIAVSILTLKYGFLLNDAAMLLVNTVAIILNTLYTLVYYKYSENKYEDVLKPLAYATALVSVFLGYAQIESHENLEYRYGLILTILMLLLLGSPLLDVKTIIAKKDASSIPFPLTLAGTIVTFLWFLYGIILLNEFMIFQNAVGFLLCLVQLILIFLYPQRPGHSKKKSNRAGYTFFSMKD